MQQNKNILIINDMPGYGKVALAAMLPILSNLGHSVYNLPTALVSNTLDYGKFTILGHHRIYEEVHRRVEGAGLLLSTASPPGFLASAEQVDIIRDFIDSQRKEDLLVMTDPIMADDGKLYNGVTEETVENMRRLIGVADVIVPNLTEAHLPHRAGTWGRRALTRHQAREVVDALLAFGPRSVVITSGAGGGDRQPRGVGLQPQTGARTSPSPIEFIKVHFPGTGDVFSAVLVGELLAGTGLEQAARKAMDTVERLVCLDRNEVEKNKGIRIERFLKELDLLSLQRAEERKKRDMWAVFALLSAVFAALTGILAKLGMEGINSNLATAIRTVVVLVMAWAIVFLTGKQHEIGDISTRSWVFLLLSGLATGLSWLCYFHALQIGQASRVIPIDKFSVVISMVLAFVVLREAVTVQTVIGGLLITAGTLVLIL